MQPRLPWSQCFHLHLTDSTALCDSITKIFKHPTILRALIFWVPVKHFGLSNEDWRHPEFLDDVLNDRLTCLDQNTAFLFSPLPSLHFPSPVPLLHRVLQNLVILGVRAVTGQEAALVGSTAPGCSLLSYLRGNIEMETQALPPTSS